MTIRDIANLLEANVHAFDEKQLDKEIETAFGSDMMSDVLAYADEGSVLLSGLLNPQALHRLCARKIRNAGDSFARRGKPHCRARDGAADVRRLREIVLRRA